MASTLFAPPRSREFTPAGVVLGGAKLYFYLSGTSTPAATYTSSAMTVQHAHPVVADTGGLFPAIWLSSNVTYDVTLKNSAGATQWTVTAYSDALLASQVGLALYPRTANEIAAAITPTAYQYPELDIRRYGAVIGATDSYSAINQAMTVAALADQDVLVVGGPYRSTPGLPFPSYFKIVGRQNATILIDGTTDDWLFEQSVATSVYSWGCIGITFGVYGTPSAASKTVGVFGLLAGDSYRGAIFRDVYLNDMFRFLKVEDNVYGQMTFDNVVGKTSGHAAPAGNICIDLGNGTANAVAMKSIELIGQYGKAIKHKGRVFSIEDFNIAGSVTSVSELDTAIHLVDTKNFSIRNGYMEKMVALSVAYESTQTTGNGSALTILIEQDAETDDFNGVIENLNVATGSIYFDGNIRNVKVSEINYGEVNGGLRVIGYPSITASKSALGHQHTGSGYVNITDDGHSGTQGFFPNPTLTGGDFSTAVSGATVSDETTDFVSGTRAIKVTNGSTFGGRAWALTLPKTDLLCTIVAKVKALTPAGGDVRLDTYNNTSRSAAGPAGHITTGVDAWQILTYYASSTTTTFDFRLRNALAGTFLIDAIQVYPGICTVDPSTLEDPKTLMPSVASATTTTLPTGGSAFNITGTTAITGVTAGKAGRIVTLKFEDSLTFTDGNNLKIAGNFATSADDTITLVSDGTNWYEMARSAN